MKFSAFFFSTLVLAVSASDLATPKQRKLDEPGFAIDLSVAFDRICNSLTNNVAAFAGCGCTAATFNILDPDAFLEITANCDVGLPFNFMLRTIITSTRLDTFQLGFRLFNNGNLPVPMLEYDFNPVDFFPGSRRDLETNEQTGVAEKGPATPSCAASYGGKHCLCSVCETSEGEKGYNTYCGELPDHIPASWRRLNEECVALKDLEFTAKAFEIMASMKEVKGTILP